MKDDIQYLLQSHGWYSCEQCDGSGSNLFHMVFFGICVDKDDNPTCFQMINWLPGN